MITGSVVRRVLNARLRDGVTAIANSCSMAGAFARDPSLIPERVVVRHTIEHVVRIRMFRALDTVACELIGRFDAPSAQAWARYARSEAIHDRYYLRDLAALGIDRSAVDATPPFRSSRQLGEFIDLSVKVFGPLPIVLYSFWAEENSNLGSLPIIVRSREVFGSGAARGATAHLALDQNLDHPEVIARILSALIKDAESLVAAANLLDTITELIGAYFSELDAWSRHSSATNAGTRLAEVRESLA